MDDAVRRVAEAVWRAMNAEAMVMSERPRAVNEALNLAESAHSGLGQP